MLVHFRTMNLCESGSLTLVLFKTKIIIHVITSDEIRIPLNLKSKLLQLDWISSSSHSFLNNRKSLNIVSHDLQIIIVSYKIFFRHLILILFWHATSMKIGIMLFPAIFCSRWMNICKQYFSKISTRSTKRLRSFSEVTKE